MTGRRLLTVLSLGGGLQSSVLAEMACDGELGGLDAICFADTGGELPETYLQVDYLRGRAEQAGIRFLTVTAGDLRRDLVARHGRGGQPTLPVMIRQADGSLGRLNHYRCSFDYKRRPISRAVKKLCGPPGVWKHAHVEQWIGYSTDEASRVKKAEQCRCGHNRVRRAVGGRPFAQIHTLEGCTRCTCSGFDPWQTNRWPLIELGMSRGDCTAWLREHHRPIPERSSCYYCPNRPASFWKSLKHERPALFTQAVALDEFLRHGINGLRGQAFLHQSGRPLTSATTSTTISNGSAPGTNSGDDLADEAGMDCQAGVCFT
jgi:hypothetical protein